MFPPLFFGIKNMNLIITTPPEAEPLTLEETKEHLRITHDADDDALNALIRVAREMCEGYTSLALITRGCSLFLDGWHKDVIELPLPPLQTVSGITIYDAAEAGAAFPSASYAVDARGVPARVMLTASPPLPGLPMGGIEIAFTTGFGDAPEDVPSSLREGMKRLVAHLYLNRGDAPETAIRNSGAPHLFQPWRVVRIS